MEDGLGDYKRGGYGKRPVWQWILLYVIIGGVLYYLAYVLFAKPY